MPNPRYKGGVQPINNLKDEGAVSTPKYRPQNSRSLLSLSDQTVGRKNSTRLKSSRIRPDQSSSAKRQRAGDSTKLSVPGTEGVEEGSDDSDDILDKTVPPERASKRSKHDRLSVPSVPRPNHPRMFKAENYPRPDHSEYQNLENLMDSSDYANGSLASDSINSLFATKRLNARALEDDTPQELVSVTKLNLEKRPSKLAASPVKRRRKGDKIELAESWGGISPPTRNRQSIPSHIASDGYFRDHLHMDRHLASTALPGQLLESGDESASAKSHRRPRKLYESVGKDTSTLAETDEDLRGDRLPTRTTTYALEHASRDGRTIVHGEFLGFPTQANEIRFGAAHDFFDERIPLDSIYKIETPQQRHSRIMRIWIRPDSMAARKSSVFDLEFVKLEAYERFQQELAKHIPPRVMRRPRDEKWLLDARHKALELWSLHAKSNTSIDSQHPQHVDSAPSLVGANPRPDQDLLKKSKRLRIPWEQSDESSVIRDTNPSSSSTPVYPRDLRRVTRSHAQEGRRQVSAIRVFDEVRDQDRVEATATRPQNQLQAWKHPLVYPAEGKKKTTVEFQDLERLHEGEFLNDNIISFYLRYLMEEIETIRPDDAKRIYWFNSFFFDRLVSSPRNHQSINYDAVKRWTKDVDLFRYDYLVLPINEAAHWYIVIICNLPNFFKSSTISAEDVMLIQESPAKPKLVNRPVKAEVRTKKPRLSSPLDPQQLEIAHHHPPETTSYHVDDAQSMHDGYGGDNQVGGQIPHEDKPVTKEASSHQGFSIEIPAMRPLLDNITSETNKTGNRTRSAGASPQGPRSIRKKRPPPRQYDLDVPAIITLDSLGLTHPQTTKLLKQYLVQEANEKKQSSSLSEAGIQGLNAKAIPLQENFCDCGLFLLAYMERFIKNPSDFVRSLLRRDPLAVDDWQELQPCAMRDKIRLIIEQEHQKQVAQKKARKRLSKIGDASSQMPDMPQSKEPNYHAVLSHSDAHGETNATRATGSIRIADLSDYQDEHPTRYRESDQILLQPEDGFANHVSPKTLEEAPANLNEVVPDSQPDMTQARKQPSNLDPQDDYRAGIIRPTYIEPSAHVDSELLPGLVEAATNDLREPWDNPRHLVPLARRLGSDPTPMLVPQTNVMKISKEHSTDVK